MRFTEPAMRPPQEARSLLLPATQGCTYNKCNFCYISRGYTFMSMRPDEFEAQAAAYKPYFPSTTRVYLTGSNPFALSTRKLKEYIAILRKYYPDFGRVSLQARIDDIARKTDEELRELKELGLSHLYIGTENGDEEVLKLMNKGHTASDTVTQLRRLDETGYGYTCFYVLGLGGKGNGIRSALNTAAMFNSVNPERITTTGMNFIEASPVAHMA
ncbi:MAG: radical SAM protein, partial [Desulfovibrio sp.]|nr:radical SAM protein [Desulfovibrio sp.]